MKHTFHPRQRITPNGIRAIQWAKHAPPVDTGRPDTQAQGPLTLRSRANGSNENPRIPRILTQHESGAIRPIPFHFPAWIMITEPHHERS
ncbi:hypothetical protein OAG07_04220 [Verrucomicrobia bacterium]|nr:hypothetical protein [Verrucomicrobiota bacterium]